MVESRQVFCICIPPDPVALETEEQSLEREQNERYVLEALGDYK
jgi:hypothetical protein